MWMVWEPMTLGVVDFFFGFGVRDADAERERERLRECERDRCLRDFLRLWCERERERDRDGERDFLRERCLFFLPLPRLRCLDLAPLSLSEDCDVSDIVPAARVQFGSGGGAGREMVTQGSGRRAKA